MGVGRDEGVPDRVVFGHDDKNWVPLSRWPHDVGELPKPLETVSTRTGVPPPDLVSSLGPIPLPTRDQGDQEDGDQGWGRRQCTIPHVRGGSRRNETRLRFLLGSRVPSESTRDRLAGVSRVTGDRGPDFSRTTSEGIERSRTGVEWGSNGPVISTDYGR